MQKREMEKNKKIPVIIYARGGSKRLPRKNVLPFCGYPLIAWAIVAARYCKYFADVWVSTDDDEIEDISREYGARVIRRPDWPDADLISPQRPSEHARVEIRKHYNFDVYSNALCTSPCWHPWDSDRLCERYFELEKKYGVIRGVSSFSEPRELVVYKKLYYDICSPVLGTKTYEYLLMGPGKLILQVEGMKRETEEQKKAEEYSDLDSVANFMTKNAFHKAIFYSYITKWYQGTDIDDQETWELNEIFMKKYILQGRGIEIYQEYAEERDGGE